MSYTSFEESLSYAFFSHNLSYSADYARKRGIFISNYEINNNKKLINEVYSKYPSFRVLKGKFTFEKVLDITLDISQRIINDPNGEKKDVYDLLSALLMYNRSKLDTFFTSLCIFYLTKFFEDNYSFFFKGPNSLKVEMINAYASRIRWELYASLQKDFSFSKFKIRLLSNFCLEVTHSKYSSKHRVLQKFLRSVFPTFSMELLFSSYSSFKINSRSLVNYEKELDKYLLHFSLPFKGIVLLDKAPVEERQEDFFYRILSQNDFLTHKLILFVANDWEQKTSHHSFLSHLYNKPFCNALRRLVVTQGIETKLSFNTRLLIASVLLLVAVYNGREYQIVNLNRQFFGYNANSYDSILSNLIPALIRVDKQEPDLLNEVKLMQVTFDEADKYLNAITRIMKIHLNCKEKIAEILSKYFGEDLSTLFLINEI